MAIFEIFEGIVAKHLKNESHQVSNLVKGGSTRTV